MLIQSKLYHTGQGLKRVIFEKIQEFRKVEVPSSLLAPPLGVELSGGQFDKIQLPFQELARRSRD